ncbi:hypothetical protein B0H14DRAFT_3005007, partial [Mycena olivaceomarginata]
FSAQTLRLPLPTRLTNLFLSSYDNASDDESSEKLLIVQSLNLDAEYCSRAQLDLYADYTERPHDIPDESQAEMLSDLFLRDLSLSILDHDQTRTEALSISPGFSPHDERESDTEAQMAVEPDTVWWGPPDADGEEMDLDAHPFDSGGSEDESSESAYAFCLDPSIGCLSQRQSRHWAKPLSLQSVFSKGTDKSRLSPFSSVPARNSQVVFSKSICSPDTLDVVMSSQGAREGTLMSQFAVHLNPLSRGLVTVWITGWS